jgi:inner membrane protein
MPSPLGHAIAGLVVHVVASRPKDLLDWPRATLIAGAALCPDLDLLLRWVDGRNHHGGAMHGVGFAALVAGAAAAFAFARRWPRPGMLGLAVGLAWSSHILLDYLNVDTHPPIGILALWPFSGAYYKFPWPIFLDIGRTLEWRTVLHNALAAAWEAALLGPLLVWAWRSRTRNGEGGPWREDSKAKP